MADFKALWMRCIFAIDANVLLHLYRYSPQTREALEQTLKWAQQRLFLPHQAAREFLANRLGVTAGQADEYARAIAKLSEITSTLTDTKKHPFLSGPELRGLSDLAPKLVAQLETQKSTLLKRLNDDEILQYVATVFDGRTGKGFSDAELKSIAADGDDRYKNEIPPGYKDGKKEASGDPYRKYGDLVIWRELMAKAKTESCPVVFVTDDRKEDWWLEQSGRTIGPRTELRDEFIRETSQDFWMYTVDKFMSEVATAANAEVPQEAIAEVKRVSEESRRLEVSESPRRRWAVLFRLATATSDVGALQFNCVYNPAIGSFAGHGGTARHVSRVDGALLAVNHQPSTHSLAVGFISLAGISAPAEIAVFPFLMSSPNKLSSSDFTVEIQEATDARGSKLQVAVEVRIVPPLIARRFFRDLR